METRSRKSRSLTPFSVEKFSQEFLDKEALAENSVRIKRQTTSYIIQESTNASIDEVTSKKKVSKKSSGAGKKLLDTRLKSHQTSDYSSDEIEFDVSFTKTISENEKNQIIEDARAAANGSGEISALNLYKKAGRYWEVYPKTDYTYSPVSKDRVEIAPGVVAMPNMSRRSIHSVHSSDSDIQFEHKQTNTESYTGYEHLNYVPRQLFNNNYEHHYVKTSAKRTQTFWSRTRTSIISTFTRIVTFVTTILYFAHRTQASLQAKLHKVSCRVLLFDTWLLWKNNPGNKTAKLTALCVIPLLLLGGWLWLSNLTNSSNSITPTFPTEDVDIPSSILTTTNLVNIQNNPLPLSNLNDNEFIINQQNTINELKKELTKLKDEISKVEQNRQDDINTVLMNLNSKQRIAPIIFRQNRCCKNPLIDIESYVNRILVGLLNDPEFLRNQKGLTDYLHTIFAAKQELESSLQNITAHLDLKYHNLIQDGTIKLMDEVTSKIKYEIIKQNRDATVDVSDISEERIKKIIRGVLAVYDADKTGLVDYAMESMGAQVLSTRCTENYNYGKAVVSVLGIPLWYPVNSPRTVLTPGISPGKCWAFQNFPGFIMIRLSKRVKIEAFSMEHISRLLVPNGDIDSAPKQFEVFGLKDEYDREPVLLGLYEYSQDGEPLQFFDVQKDGQVFEIIELRINSNHGNPNYTCLYRFRVHGRTV